MNRRQRRAIAKKFPGYKKLLNEAKDKTFEEFQEMIKKRWAALGITDGEGAIDMNSHIPANAAFSSEDNKIQEKTPSKNETKNANGEENGAV